MQTKFKNASLHQYQPRSRERYTEQKIQQKLSSEPVGTRWNTTCSAILVPSSSLAHRGQLISQSFKWFSSVHPSAYATRRARAWHSIIRGHFHLPATQTAYRLVEGREKRTLAARELVHRRLDMVERKGEESWRAVVRKAPAITSVTAAVRAARQRALIKCWQLTAGHKLSLSLSLSEPLSS